MRFLTLIISFVFLIFSGVGPSFSYTVRTYTPVNKLGNVNIYGNNLNRVERYLFGKTYAGLGMDNRLNRIEKRLFNTTYPAMNYYQRMNNILANYSSQHSNYQCNSLKSKLLNSLIGQPTGYSPQINSEYINSYGQSYTRGFYGTNGWRNHNIYTPSAAGASINILD